MNEIALVFEFGIGALVLVNHGVADLGEEHSVNAEQAAVTCGTAKQTAQDIAASVVGGHDAVADHEGGGTDMVGDDAEGNIGLGIVAVFYICNFTDVLHDVLHGVHKEKVVNALHHTGETLQTHTGIDVGVIKGCVGSLAVGIKLGKDVVPDFDVSVAVAADPAGFLAAAVFLTAVEVDFRAGTAGAFAVLPEIVFLAQTDNSVG